MRETGSTDAARIGCFRKRLLADHGELLRELTTGRPGITLAEISAELVARGVALGCLATTRPALRRLCLLQKKGA